VGSVGDTRCHAYALVYLTAAVGMMEGPAAAIAGVAHEKGLRLAHQSGDPWTLGMHSWMAGYFHFYGGDVARGREFLKRALDCCGRRAINGPYRGRYTIWRSCSTGRAKKTCGASIAMSAGKSLTDRG